MELNWQNREINDIIKQMEKRIKNLIKNSNLNDENFMININELRQFLVMVIEKRDSLQTNNILSY